MLVVRSSALNSSSKRMARDCFINERNYNLNLYKPTNTSLNTFNALAHKFKA